jgi:hypothetical protein
MLFPKSKNHFSHQYISDDGSRILMHYLGDETKYKDFDRGITPKRKSQTSNLFKIKKLKTVSSAASTSNQESPNLVTVYSYKDIVPSTKTSIKIERQLQ